MRRDLDVRARFCAVRIKEFRLGRWTAICAAVVLLILLATGAARRVATDATARVEASPAGNGPRAGTSLSSTALRARTLLNAGLDSLDTALLALAGTTPTAGDPRAAFRVARRRYKRIEALVTYYAPPVATALNAPVGEEQGDEQTVGKTTAAGFQRLEPTLFPAIDRPAWSASRNELVAMRAAVHALRRTSVLLAPTDVQLLDAARLELGRVSTLGIAGFDATASGDAMAEAAAALDGVRAWLPSDIAGASLVVDQRLADAAAYLRANADFNAFDRFHFITAYISPAFDAIAALRRSLQVPDAALRRTWPASVASIYDARGFDPLSYAPTDAPRPTPALLALGRDLFFDPALSGNGQRACASCHLPERAFTDGRPRARPFGADVTPPTRHTPSLINAGYQPAQFADERAASLEDQIADVLASPSEMRSSLETAVGRLNASAEYRERFARATGARGAGPIAARSVQLALAAYVRSLAGYDSRFDRAVRGDTAQLDPAARRGFNLFMGKAACGTCHFAPLFNGTAPPDFVASEVEVVGVPSRPVVRRATIDADGGRGAFDHLEGHAHAFKTPTVRNAVLTGPYMHNGVYATLDDVLDFYNRGGGAGIGAQVPNQTLASRPLNLSRDERQALVAFLAALVDTTAVTGRPARLPRFDGPAGGADRPVGGTY